MVSVPVDIRRLTLLSSASCFSPVLVAQFLQICSATLHNYIVYPLSIIVRRLRTVRNAEKCLLGSFIRVEWRTYDEAVARLLNGTN